MIKNNTALETLLATITYFNFSMFRTFKTINAVNKNLNLPSNEYYLLMKFNTNKQ